MFSFALCSIIRTSPTILLSTRMQEFFVQLLMRISNDLLASDYVWHKRWQITIADLVYLLLSKGKSHNDEIQSNFSENIENLFNLIDMIDIYLDSTQTKSFPEKGYLEKPIYIFKKMIN